LLWQPGIRREQQIDYAECSHSRLKGHKMIGRKYNCAFCIVVCPHGVKNPTAGALPPERWNEDDLATSSEYFGAWPSFPT
jgi:hypothetical protein